MGIRLDNSFTVAAGPEQTWRSLLDVPLVVSCMPGAELTGTLSDNAWTSRLTVKLGPMTLVFAADLERLESDDDTGLMVIVARARELKGRGGANARLEAHVSAVDGGSRVDIGTDVSLSGTAAQFGRPVVQDVAHQLVETFSKCLQATLGAGTLAATTADLAPASEPVPPDPISGLALVYRALVRRFAPLFGRPR